MKIIYSLLLLFFLLFQIQLQATEFMLQDVPRAAASFSLSGKSKIDNQQIITGPDQTFTMDNIVNWIGKGSRRAAMVVQWNDGKQPDAMVWGYRWDGEVSDVDMIKAIAKSDPRLFILISDKERSIGGIGYKLDKQNPIKLTLRGVDQKGSERIFTTNQLNDFDLWKSDNPYNHWCSGWQKGFWFFNVRESNTVDFKLFTLISQHRPMLRDGSWVGLWYGKFEDRFNIQFFYQFTASPKNDNTMGVFFLNEGYFGQNHGTLNLMSSNGEFLYGINAEGTPLGIRSVFGTIFAGKLFVISKLDKRVVVADALTLDQIATIDTIKSPSNREADGRAFVGITPELGYISTSNGICTFNLKNYRIGEFIAGTDGETGNMIHAANHVFAVQRNRVLILKNNVVESTISGCEYSSVCRSKDGMVWIAAESVLIRVDPFTLEQEIFMLPHRAKIANSWDDWNAGSFCASTQKNALYWTKPGSCGGAREVYCYDGSSISLMAPIYTLPEGQMLYGAGIRVHPVTNLLYITSTRNMFFNFNKNWVHVLDAATGKKINEYELNSYNWFPAMPIFPEAATPSTAQLAPVISNKNHKDMKHRQAYRSGDRLFNLPAGAVVQAYNMSGALCFKMKANRSELKIPQKGFLLFHVISEDGIQVIR